MPLNSLQKLLVDELKDLYSAENQLLKALPKMAKGATSPALKEAFQMHLEQTRTHVERLDQVAQMLGEKSLKGKKCVAMEGLIEEGKEILEEEGEDAVIDAALIAAAQKVEHYEIAAYGTARTHARMLKLPEVAQVLQQTLDEEGQTDKNLTRIAERGINYKAMMEGENGSAGARKSGGSKSGGSKSGGSKRSNGSTNGARRSTPATADSE